MDNDVLRIIVKEIERLSDEIEEVKRLLVEQINRQNEFEKQVLKDIAEIKASAVTKNGMSKIQSSISNEIGEIYDRLSNLEVQVAELRSREESFREGESWVIEHWDKVLAMILSLLLILQYLRG